MSKQQQQQSSLGSPAAAAAAVSEEPLTIAPAPSAAVEPPAPAVTPSAAAESTTSSSKRTANSAIEPLPEQSLGCKRARRSPRTFNWMSILALVEVQLVLRRLDVRSRLIAARCNKQLYAAASHPFAWPQEQMATLRVDNRALAMHALGRRVRGSLLRLSAIHLRVQLSDEIVDVGPLCSDLFAVPNVQSLVVQQGNEDQRFPPDFLLPMLLHPATQQLRSLDIFDLVDFECTPAELQQLATLPQLQSLSLGTTVSANFPFSLPQSSVIFPSLTHLSLYQPDDEQAQLYSPLSRCPRLTSLKLEALVLSTEIVDCLAQLPLLQRLQLCYGGVAASDTHAWTAVRSLREIELDYVHDGPPLLSMLCSIPALRLLRWRCRVPQYSVYPYLPSLATLSELMLTTPLLRVELIMPRTLDQWRVQTLPHTVSSTDVDMLSYQRQRWDELQQLLTELPRGRIVVVEPEDDEHQKSLA